MAAAIVPIHVVKTVVGDDLDANIVICMLCVLGQMDYLGEQTTFKPEQVVAMLLTQLKKIGEMNLGSKVTDCVISVRVYTAFSLL